MGTRDEPRPSSALPLPVPLPPATLCDAAFPPYPTPFAREGRNFLRDPSGKAHLLRNASSCRVGARICVCIFRGGGTAGDLLPRGAEHASSRAAQRGRGVVRGCSLPPSLFFFLPPPPPAGQRRRAQRGWADGASCGRASRLRAGGAGGAGGRRSPPGSRLLGPPLLKFGRQRGLCGKLEARSPHRGAPRGRPRGCGAAAATRSHRGLGAERVGTPRNPPPWEAGSGSVPPPRVGAGGIRGGGCARTWGAGNGVCRRDGDKDNGICFGNGAKIMGFALGMVTKIRCRLPADRAGEALCRLLRFGRAAA